MAQEPVDMLLSCPFAAQVIGQLSEDMREQSDDVYPEARTAYSTTPMRQTQYTAKGVRV